jgi:hypothetical protein
MDSYTIDMAGSWRLYQHAIPGDWIIFGTIRRDSDQFYAAGFRC